MARSVAGEVRGRSKGLRRVAGNAVGCNGSVSTMYRLDKA